MTGDELGVDVLGPLVVRRGDRAVEVVGPRLRTLLVRLAVAAGRPVSASLLVERLWPDRPAEDAANALQSLVSRLRRALGDGRLVVQSAAGYHLRLGADGLDAARFDRLARTGREHRRAGSDELAADACRDALALWRGEVAGEVEAADAARWTERRLEVLADRIEADLALGRHHELVVELESLWAAHPLREQFAGQLMTALAGCGRQAEALATYEQVRATLGEELGIDPSADLRERHLAILRAPAPAPTSPARTNLPSTLTSFVGRDDDVARVGGLLAAGRLVSVLGPGGAGKTRLAIEAASRRPEVLPDGVWFVELAPLTDPAEVAHAVLASVDLRDTTPLDPRVPRRPREALERLLDVLGSRECLLVVDNCEHVLDAVAHLVDTLLARCPGLRILTTTREPLGIAGEALVPLSSLPVPSADATAAQARDLSSVALFVDRAVAVRPSFVLDGDTVAAVVEIVRRLDGLPLAIELATARLRSLPPAEIAARLGDRFRLLTGGSRTALPRHRTLRAVVDWSWELLTAPERLLAERVAAFPAGVTPASAAAVCAGDVPDADVADLLGALVDRSLLQLADDEGPRYRMLETIREYGTDRLAEREELAAVRRAHARYFAALVARADPALRTAAQRGWLRTLDAEHDNVLAALRTYCDTADAPAAVTLALDLAWYWTMTDRHAEAATWMGIVLAVPGEVQPAARLAAQAIRVVNGMAVMELAGDDPRRSLQGTLDELATVDDQQRPTLAVLVPLMQFFAGDVAGSARSLDVAVDHDDPWVSAMACAYRARFAENVGDLDRVRADTDRAAAVFELLGDRWALTRVLPLMAQLCLYQGDLDGALAALGKVQDLLAEFASTDADDRTLVDLMLADVRFRRGDTAGARESAARATRVAADRGEPELTVIALALASSHELEAGDLPAARDLQRRAEELLPRATARTTGADHGVAVVSASGALLDIAAGERSTAADRLAAGYAAARRTGDQPILGTLAVAVAALAVAEGRPREGARVLGGAARLRGADDPTHRTVRRLSTAIREALGDAGHRAAWQEGWDDRQEAADRVDPAVVLGSDDLTGTAEDVAAAPAATGGQARRR